MMAVMTSEQKSSVRAWYADAAEKISKSIDKEIEHIGGRDMLPQRMDVLFWVDSASEDLHMCQEVLRMLDGERDVDVSLVDSALQRAENWRRKTLRSIEISRQVIREAEEKLRRDEALLPQYAFSVQVLEETLKEYRGRDAQ